MSFNDYRNNDLAKYRSTFSDYTINGIIGRSESIAPDNFYNMGNVSGTVSLDISKYSYFKMTLLDDVVISGTHSLPHNRLNTFYVELSNPNTYGVTWDSWFEWSASSTPDCSISGTYLLSFTETNIINAGVLSYTNCIGYLG